MRKKQFKSESKRLMDLVINSVYAHKEIFLREIISNASDALDKLYFRSLTDSSVGLGADDFVIRIDLDKENRTISVSDNGCGMTEEELDCNLGTIAKSGSFAFRNENADAKDKDIDIIGRFGIGFYSAFMVSDRVAVESRAFGSDRAFRWESSGADGYSISPCEKEGFGTTVVMHIKPDSDDENYGKFLNQYTISSLVKKYSDYIRHPIKMEFTESRPVEGKDGEFEEVTETRVLNGRIPLWKKNRSEITPEEYNNFYKENFFDYEDPAKVIHTSVEGRTTYRALLFIPKNPPFGYYSKDFEKGLRLYSQGVLVMDKCAELLPDYFSFVRGLVDGEDVSLNVSRETLQNDSQLKLIAKTLEKKIRSELEKTLKNDREAYEEFFKAFGTQLKFGVYDDYGARKDDLKDLLLFISSREKKFVTLKEYSERAKEGQKSIYYACGETVENIETLPRRDFVSEKGYEILYLTDYIDEFALKIAGEYDGRKFVNINDEESFVGEDEEKKAVESENERSKDMLEKMKNVIGDAASAVRFTGVLKNHPVCLTSEGGVSLDMEKTINATPGAENRKVRARIVLEINAGHPIAAKLKKLYAEDEETFEKYAKLLYSEACLISGRRVENPAEHSRLVCELMAK